MSTRRAALVLACVALSGGALGACGGSDTAVDSVPKSTPDLTVPSNSSAVAPAQTTSTSTTATTTTPTTTTPSAGGVAPTTTQSTSTPSGGTPSGGTATPTTTTPSSGGTPAGGFSDFCKQNPGACGQ